MPLNAHETAIHEAGHAVAHVRLGIFQGRVTIVPTDLLLGSCEAEGASHVWSAVEAADQLVAYCAGYAALVAAGFDPMNALEGADDDFDHAVELIDCWNLEGDLDHWKERSVALMREPRNLGAVKLLAERLEQEKSLDEDIVRILVEVADGDATQADLERYLLLRADSGKWTNAQESSRVDRPARQAHPPAGTARCRRRGRPSDAGEGLRRP